MIARWPSPEFGTVATSSSHPQQRGAQIFGWAESDSTRKQVCT